jgi:cell division protein FtsB
MRELRYSDYYASYDELKNDTSYVYGNTALSLEPARKPQKKKAQKPKLHVVKKRKQDLYTRAQARRNTSVLFVTIAALLTFYFFCMSYLQIQAEVGERADTISELEEEYVALKTENDLLAADLNGSIDYEYVLDVALNELGMVYADQDQVIVYNSQKMECVKQLSNIPEK